MVNNCMLYGVALGFNKILGPEYCRLLYAEGCMAQDEGRQKKSGEQGESRTFCQSTCALLRIMVTME